MNRIFGYTGISREELKRTHNIAAHHAMGLYAAGKALDRPSWCEQAAGFLAQVAAEQEEGGYWSENVGPVVGYNFVYLDALGTYYAMSGDRRVLPVLEKGARFHHHFTYPDGKRVETVDERNSYKKTIDAGNVGFTFTQVGRTYLQAQWSRRGEDQLGADLLASLLFYGEEGTTGDNSSTSTGRTFVLTEKNTAKASITRSGPWFVCLSAYTAPIPESRWIQDRQNLVSIFHGKVGLVLGGGNTKLQPAWSNFTAGDVALLRHQEGDTNPSFLPNGELYHVPAAAKLTPGPEIGLDLDYGPEACRIRVRPRNERTLEYVVEATLRSGLPVVAHLTLIPTLKSTLASGGGQNVVLDSSPIDWDAAQVGGQVTHAGYRLQLPESATLHWPALPHNPYRKDGRATPGEGRIEVRIPFDSRHTRHTILLEILE